MSLYADPMHPEIAKKNAEAAQLLFEEPRYFISQDGDCHWFIVPVNKRREWEAWREIGDNDPDDPAGWEAPDFAVSINDPSQITFTNYKEEI